MKVDQWSILCGLSTWAGICLIGHAIWSLVQSSKRVDSARSRLVAAMFGLGGAICLVGSTLLSPPSGARGTGALPIVWPVLPFFWLYTAALSLVAITAGIRLALSHDWAARRKYVRILVWCMGGVALFSVLAMMSREEARLLIGAVPLDTALKGTFMFSVIVLVAWIFGRATNKSDAFGPFRILAVCAVSLILLLPVAWMVVTSFKEYGDITGQRITWIPQVSVRHSYFDKERPLVTTQWQGETVWGTVIEARDGSLHLEVERPFLLRGTRLNVDRSETRPAARSAPVVRLSVNGTEATGFERRVNVGGEREVEILTPASLAGRVVTTDDTSPVRKVGIRWDNYSDALEWLPAETNHGLVYFQNSLFLAFMSVLGTCLSCPLVAFAFARLKFPGKGVMFALLVGTMLVPPAVTLVPKFLLWRQIGAYGTLVPIWLPTFTSSAFFVFLIREFLKSVPRELESAAYLDGANFWVVYWSIVLPQLKPVLVVIGMWTAIGAWNDFMGPLIYVSDSSQLPLTYAVQLFTADKSGDFELMTAFSVMASVPVVGVFFLAQRKLFDSVRLSGRN